MTIRKYTYRSQSIRKFASASRRIRHIFAFISMIAISVAILLLIFKPKTTQAAWFDDSWGYRKAITLTVASNSSDITNLETLLTIDTTGITANVQTNCEDLRFANAGGKILPYYIDTCSDNSATNKVWVMVDLVPKNTTTYTLYMYYGNPSALSKSDSNLFYSVRGLVGYWAMNEASWNGTTGEVKDSSVNGNNGTSVSGANTTSSGKYSYGGSFDGTDDYVGITNNQTLDVTTTYTLSAWVMPDQIRNYEVIFIRGSNTASDIELYIRAADLAIVHNRNNGGTMTYHTNITNPPTGQWTHIVLTYDQTNKWRLYYNGLEKSLGSFEAGSGESPLDTNKDWHIGQTDNTGTFGSNNEFDGTIDDARIYNRALSPTEVQQLYANPGTIATTATTNSLPTTSFASEEKAPGPVAYWDFDDGTGTLAQDRTTNNNDGTISGASWQTEDLCISGKCLKFNGTSDNVSIGNTINGVQTLAFWVKPTSITASIFQLTSSTYITASSGTISATGFTTPSIYVNGQLGTTIISNQWNFIEVTTGTGINADALLIGKANDSYTSGFIDEPKIYNYARSASQILLDYNSKAASLAKGAGTLLGAQTTDALNNGLVGYWKMDESDWTNDCTATSVTDSSGNGNSGKSCPSTTGPTTAAGKFGNGGSFDGTDDKVTVSDSNLFSFGDGTADSSFTISTWVYSSGGATINKYLLNKDDGSSNSEWQLYLRYPGSGTATDPSFCMNDESSGGYECRSSSADLSSNTWYHVLVTYDGRGGASASDGLRIYVNGARSDDTTLGGGSYVAMENLTAGVTMADYGSDAQNWDFNGRLDDVRIYNRALSPTEVSQLYTFAPGPVGYWKMDEGTGNPADSSGNGNNGTWNGTGSHWTNGKYGKAGNFDGSSDYVSLSSSGLVTATSDYTIEAWVNPDTISGTDVIYAQANTANNTQFLKLELLNGTVGYDIRDDANTEISNYTT